MADFIEKVKEFIAKIVETIKSLIAKLTGAVEGGEDESKE